MQASGRHHASAAVPSGKESPVLYRMQGGFQSRIGRYREEKNLFLLSEIEPRLFSPYADAESSILALIVTDN
jgi:hypothetical protein